MFRKVSLIFTFLIHLQTNADLVNSIYTELAKFKSNRNQNLTAAYIQAFPTYISNVAIESDKKFVLDLKNGCVDQINVDFINTLTGTTDKNEIDFESGFIRIEAIKCFKNIPAEALLLKSANMEFKRKAFSTITDIYAKDDLICEKTYAPTIGKSSYCYKTEYNKVSNVHLNLRSFNVWNDSIEVYGAPVYFRLISETAIQINENTAYHVVSYVRGPKLNFLQKTFAKGAIENTQKTVFRLLQDEFK